MGSTKGPGGFWPLQSWRSVKMSSLAGRLVGRFVRLGVACLVLRVINVPGLPCAAHRLPGVCGLPEFLQQHVEHVQDAQQADQDDDEQELCRVHRFRCIACSRRRRDMKARRPARGSGPLPDSRVRRGRCLRNEAGSDPLRRSELFAGMSSEVTATRGLAVRVASRCGQMWETCGHSVRCRKQVGVLDGDGRVVDAVPFGVSPFSG